MHFSESLLKEIGAYFLDAKEKIAVAESVTAGYLQNAFSQITNASEFFNGGITAYTLETKVKLLNINPKEADKEDCVSKNIAEKMALEVSLLLDTEWSIAITGYATPVPESDHQLYAYYSICYLGKIILSEKVELFEAISSAEAQKLYVERILEDLYDEIQKRN